MNFHFFQCLIACTMVFHFACTGNERDKGVSCKRKLFSGAIMPGLHRNLHNVILSTDIQSFQFLNSC